MTAVAILAIADAAMAILEKAIPAIQAMFKKGEIPPEEQQRIRDRYNAIKSGAAFEGPEWQLEP